MFEFFKNRTEKKKQKNEKCNQMIAEITRAINTANNITFNNEVFVEPSEAFVWRRSFEQLFYELQATDIRKLRKANQYQSLCMLHNNLYQTSQNLPNRISDHNNYVANLKINHVYQMIGNVENRLLDYQQMMCIAKELHNHLVIAGAGTGKTTTIIGKIKYLLNTGKCKPEDILVLSFTKASASEMSERIAKETNSQIDAMTFHKLGLQIITKANGITPKISSLNQRKFISEQLQQNMKNPEYRQLLSEYLFYNRVPAKSEFDFKTKSEYDEYIRLNPPMTIQNESVKSYGEMDIANFLLENGIQYEYEKAYEMDTRTEEYGEYHPDFYLTEYGIYIEYFGINRKGEVPEYFSAKNGKSPSESYRDSMNWKREIHKANQTVLIECYAYEKFEGDLLDNLKKKLEEKLVEFHPKNTDEIWKMIAEKNDSMLDGIIDLFQTLINLIKSNNYAMNELRARNIPSYHYRNNSMILELLEPIFLAYCNYMNQADEIDFNDMINVATEYVQSGRYHNPYKYVIVDEYQDISKARYRLLYSLRESNDFDLFCVGDDWQSIYRFAGSDINYILQFNQYWGPTEVSRIETTYRFSQSLIDVSGNFVMCNPSQIKKYMRGNSDNKGFAVGEITGYTDKYAMDYAISRLDDLPKGSSVFFIGRYIFDSKILEDHPLLSCKYNQKTSSNEVIYKKRSDLKISFVTAHKSKGLQADYVFIINNKNSKMGFPSKIQDAPILQLLLENYDEYPFAEERRLFYVSLTRAKIKTFLVVNENQKSDFIHELESQYMEQFKDERFTCPWCGGRLIKRKSKNGEFFGCSNYRTMNCRYTRNIKRRAEFI